MTASAVLATLLEGNARFATYASQHPNTDRTRREAANEGQTPVAAILGCADSRVPPELIFDQGVGDLFVVRSAGHALDTSVTGSLEYAVAHLKVPLIMVLAHTRCGAVTAAASGTPDANPHLEALLTTIRSSTGDVSQTGDNSVARMIDEHARRTQAALSDMPLFAKAIAADSLHIVACRYALDTGRVSLL